MPRLDFLSFNPDFSSPALVAAYDELPLWSAMFGLLLLDEVPLAGVHTALDVGCGTGFPLIELAERLGPDAVVHGIDPWREALVRAGEKARTRGTNNVTIHPGSANEMPFADSTFDLIVSNLGLNNFDDREAAIRECRRVIRPDGRLALTTNLQGHMAEFYELFAADLDAPGHDAARDRLSTHIAQRATVASVRDLLAHGGFEVTRVIERTARMRFANGTALLNHYFIKLGFLGGWKQVVAGEEEPVFSRLLDRLDTHAQEAGELSLTIPMAYIEARVRA
jgi:SAM-dependent methyltransferase